MARLKNIIFFGYFLGSIHIDKLRSQNYQQKSSAGYAISSEEVFI
jgi:hypothetical protein